MLELCRCTGIRQFHHVSTAYVCGLREGRVLESDVDVGQTTGNVYEKTKLQAECSSARPISSTRPRSIGLRSSSAIRRPDTRRTYHGFYAPLKLAHTMVSKVARGATAGRTARGGLGIQGGTGRTSCRSIGSRP